VDFGLARRGLTTALNQVITAEPDITQYDTIVGDGDCGVGLKRGAEGKHLPGSLDVNHVRILLNKFSNSENVGTIRAHGRCAFVPRPHNTGR